MEREVYGGMMIDVEKVLGCIMVVCASIFLLSMAYCTFREPKNKTLVVNIYDVAKQYEYDDDN